MRLSWLGVALLLGGCPFDFGGGEGPDLPFNQACEESELPSPSVSLDVPPGMPLVSADGFQGGSHAYVDLTVATASSATLHIELLEGSTVRGSAVQPAEPCPEGYALRLENIRVFLVGGRGLSQVTLRADLRSVDDTRSFATASMVVDVE